jgi:hypothetical protein
VVGRWTKRSFLSRALRLALVSCAILAGGLALTAAAASARAPLIGPVSASAGFYGEGLIETQIDPEGYETTYKISADCEVPVLCQHTEGTLPADNEEHPISLKLAGLKPGVTYHFDIYATSNAGEMNWPGEFTAPVIPPGACPNGCSTTGPYEPAPVTQGELELTQQEADRIAARAEAERQQHAHEHEEQLAKEDAVRYASEAAELKRREEEEATAQSADHAVPMPCIVPSLKGDTLQEAQRALNKAHCRLGSVTRRKGHDLDRLVVTQQRVGAGRKMPRSTPVGITLGPRRS